MDNEEEKIEKYYDNVQFLYDRLWSNKGMHYGLWDKGTKNISDAVENTNRFVSQLLGVQRDDYVLDVGCGIGGTCFFIVKNFGAKVTGITLSSKQIEQARKTAKKLHLSHSMSFRKMDFSKMEFDDKTFTKICGIESVCHAPDKQDFLQEAYRVLKPGGKIVICDGFLIRTDFDKEEEKIYQSFLKRWVLPELTTKEQFRKYLKMAGFKNIRYYDKTKEVLPSSQRMYRLGIVSFPLICLCVAFRLLHKEAYGHSIAMLRQKAIFDRCMGTYGVFIAEK